MIVSESPVAVLVSGGLDSAVLLGHTAGMGTVPAIYPLYIRCGLAWEAAEREYLGRFLAALAEPVVKPLVTLDMPVADLYQTHWSLTGTGVPGAESPDAAVYLPGRNVLLLSKTLLWCHLHDVPILSLAVLNRNPFPDATPSFFAAFAAAVNQAIGGKVEVVAPYAGWSKAEIIRRFRHLPLQHTLSCLQPVAGRHCGQCNKCAERRAAFVAADVADPTDYFAPAMNGA